ncbi:hypothetical protein RZS08_34190, partial [Arthrospira platensis SPKY1]|nr:hypothetical protein [Arthrospira platensis SPKY1]
MSVLHRRLGHARHMPVHPGQFIPGRHQFPAGFQEEAFRLDVVADRLPGVLAVGQPGVGRLQPHLPHLAC